MKFAWPKHWFAPRVSNEAEERSDVAYIKSARQDAKFRPLREVLADVEGQERAELSRPIRTAS